MLPGIGPPHPHDPDQYKQLEDEWKMTVRYESQYKKKQKQSILDTLAL